MKILLFGANGYLGKNLSYFLKQKDVTLFTFDIQSSSILQDINYQKLDITIPDNFSNIDLNVDLIYFFAGLTGTWQGFEEYDKYIDVNEKGLLNLLTEMVRQKSKAKVIFPSTRLVYKGKKDILLKESDEKETKTIYALNKLNCEQMLEMYKAVFNINYTVYRICVPYGHLIPGGESYGTIGFFMNQIKNHKKIALFGDGSLRRTFTHIADLCNAIYQTSIVPETDGEIYNIGGENFSLYEVAQLFSRKHSITIENTPWPENALKIESGDTIFDGSKLDKIYGESNCQKLENWILQS